MSNEKSAASSKSSRLWQRTFPLLIVGLLGWFGLVRPGYYYLEAKEIKFKQTDSSPPSPSFLKKLEFYQKAASSPFFQSLALRENAKLLIEHFYPAQLSRSFRLKLAKGRVSEWERLFVQWEQGLKKLEKIVPGLYVQHLRAFLYLQLGKMDKLNEWGKKLADASSIDSPLKTRSQAMLRIWLGHAAFFTGHPKRAEKLYGIVLTNLARHPRWDLRSPKNWRLPAEISAVYYHTGVLHLKNNRAEKALYCFQRLIKRWEIAIKTPKSSPLWYTAHLWAANAALQLKRFALAKKLLKSAGQFQHNRILVAQLSGNVFHPQSPELARLQWKALLKKQASNKYSYGDQPFIAGLSRVRSFLQSRQYKNAISELTQIFILLRKRPWPTGLHTLTARKTGKFRYIPYAPQLLKDIQKLLPHKMASPKLQALLHVLHSELLLYRGLSHTKLYSWDKAEGIFEQLIQKSQTTLPKPAPTSRPTSAPTGPTNLNKRGFLASRLSLSQYKRLLKMPYFGANYLMGMLMVERRKYQKSLKYLRRLHHPKHSGLWDLYYVFALHKSKKRAEAKKHLKSLELDFSYQPTLSTLGSILKGQPFPKKRVQTPGFWWYIFGLYGWMAESDTYLSKLSNFWRAEQSLSSYPDAWKIYHSVHVSQRKNRLGFQTFISKYRRLASLYSKAQEHKKAKEYLRRVKYLTSFYQDFPHMWYFLDRVFYTHHLGLFAMGLF